MTARAFISGCSGTQLTAEEKSFFAGSQPWGLIVFKRNCRTPGQLRDLAAEFRHAVGRFDAPVFIDQEGGRVRRLIPPEWPDYPACRVFGLIAEADPDRGARAAWLHGRLIAADLADAGITVNCLPVLDVIVAGASEAIGNRSFGGDSRLVALLGRAMADGLVAGGVAPVVKHIPGQGRATTDSHHHLPVVDADRDQLAETDFVPFAALADLPAAMTGHVVYSAIDPGHPATTSPIVIRDIIRKRIGFDGLLMSDDISMKALSGGHAERAAAIYEAGCDIVLHCSSVMEEMRAIAAVAPQLQGRAAERAGRLLGVIRPPSAFDGNAAREEYLALTADAGLQARV